MRVEIDSSGTRLILFEKEEEGASDPLEVSDMYIRPELHGQLLRFGTAYEGSHLTRAEVKQLHHELGQWLDLRKEG